MTLLSGNYLELGDTPAFADPAMSWPIYGKVGGYIIDGPVVHASPRATTRKHDLFKDDEEILIILSAVIRNL